MKKYILLFGIFAAIISNSFANGTEEMELISNTGVNTGPRFVLTLKPGTEYSKTINYFVFKYTVYPQVAVWLETLEGSYIDTLFVTEKGNNGDWKGAPKEGRPEALPVWFNIPKDSVDGVSAATSTKETDFGSSLSNSFQKGTYRIKLETNRSYDYNDVYTKKKGVNGQPSIIYECILKVEDTETKGSFSPIGIGSQDGSNGDITLNLNGIDTALNLFSVMEISYIPE